MRYALLICDEEKWLESLTEAEGTEMLARYGAFGEEMASAACSRPESVSGRRLTPPRSECETVRSSLRTVRLLRPRSRWAVFTSSTARISTKP